MRQQGDEKTGEPLQFRRGAAPNAIAAREVTRSPSERARRLLQEYYDAKVSLSLEFPYWYTRTHRESEGEHPYVQRARSLKSAFEHLTPMIRPGELLVMQKTKYVRGASPVPWTTNRIVAAQKPDAKLENSAERGLEKVVVGQEGGGSVHEDTGSVMSISGRFGLRKEEYPILTELCRYWTNRSSEDTCFKWAAMHPKYDEFMALKKIVMSHADMEYGVRHGRNVISYQLPLQLGFAGMLEKCREPIGELIRSGRVDEVAFLQASVLVIEGVQAWIKNYAREARRLAQVARTSEQGTEFAEIAERLEWIAVHPPRTFREGLQLCWTCHVAVMLDINGSGFSPGRLGQILYPLWKRDLEEGRVTREETLELLECMRVKFTEIDIMTSIATKGALAGSTFNHICVGGLKPDGSSAENELEELLIESAMTCATPQPTLSVIYDPKLSERFLLKAVECNKTGAGYPAWINNRVAMDYLQKTFQSENISLEDMRAWTIGGCLEAQPGALVNGQFGAGSYSSTGVAFLNMPKILELVLWNGQDPRTGIQALSPHGSALESFDELYRVFKDYFREIQTLFAEMYNLRASATLEIDNPIFYSALTQDCIEKRKDMDHGGCRYSRTMTAWICGQVNLVNSLISIRMNVYESGKFSLDALKEALINNFGYKSALETSKFSMLEQEQADARWAEIHAACLKAPKFGNDDPRVDRLYKDVIEYWRDLVEEVDDFFGRPYVPSLLSVATHGALGQADIASPDGRLAGLTLADGAQSPYPGTDLNGPYAILNSATVIEHSDYMNTQLNLKIHPCCIEGRSGSKKLLDLTRAYMHSGGFHIQYNVVDSRMLKKAQLEPDNYRDLLVRVAGFTQYWVELSKPIQDELIARTEYAEV